MKFSDVIAKRRSIRSFLQTSIDEKKLRRILEAACAAPSAGNLQSYEIYVVTGKRKREALGRAAHEQLFIVSAPVSLVFCARASRCSARYGRRSAKLYSVQDASIACAFAMLAATDLGIGSVWVGAFDPADIRPIVGASAGEIPVSILPLGYPAEHPGAPERRALDDLTHPVE